MQKIVAKITKFEDIFRFYKSFADFQEFYNFLDKKLSNMKSVLDYLKETSKKTIDNLIFFARDQQMHNKTHKDLYNFSPDNTKQFYQFLISQQISQEYNFSFLYHITSQYFLKIINQSSQIDKKNQSNQNEIFLYLQYYEQKFFADQEQLEKINEKLDLDIGNDAELQK